MKILLNKGVTYSLNPKTFILDGVLKYQIWRRSYTRSRNGKALKFSFEAVYIGAAL